MNESRQCPRQPRSVQRAGALPLWLATPTPPRGVKSIRRRAGGSSSQPKQNCAQRDRFAPRDATLARSADPKGRAARDSLSPLVRRDVGQEASCLSSSKLVLCFMLNPSPLPSALNVFKGSGCFLRVLGARFSVAEPALAPSLKRGFKLKVKSVVSALFLLLLSTCGTSPAAGNTWIRASVPLPPLDVRRPAEKNILSIFPALS